MIYEHVGDRIRYLREERGLKQKELAKRFYVEENTWSQYEKFHRKPNIDIIKGVAEFFEVSSDYLLGITDKIYSNKDDNIVSIIEIYTSLDENEKTLFMEYIRAFNKGVD